MEYHWLASYTEVELLMTIPLYEPIVGRFVGGAGKKPPLFPANAPATKPLYIHQCVCVGGWWGVGGALLAKDSTTPVSALCFKHYFFKETNSPK